MDNLSKISNLSICMKTIKLRVEEEFNYRTFCICLIFIPLIILAILGGGCSSNGDCCSNKKKQEKKDETEVREKRDKCCLTSGCYDGNHFCPECGNFLGKFKSSC